VDLGAATAGSVAFAIAQLGLCGGLLVGGSGTPPRSVAMKLWHEGPRPLSAGAGLDAIRQTVRARPDRPTRRYGGLRRFQASAGYLSALADSFHGLRPLRLVLDSDCPAAADHLRQLTAATACQVLPSRSGSAGLARQVVQDNGHLAVRIRDDGEICQVLDESGRPVDSLRLALLLARHLSSDNSPTAGGAGTRGFDSPRPRVGARHRPPLVGQAGPGKSVVVVEQETQDEAIERLGAVGIEVVGSPSRRSAMYRVMEDRGALFGGGPTGRFWYRAKGDLISADAILTVTHLLGILSRSDHGLSQVLDAEAPAG
jgi:phosphomannomutase